LLPKILKEKSSQDIITKIKKMNDERYKTFITQAPVAIAMFDNNMLFMAASQKWISDFRLQHKEFIGKSVYEVIPEIELRYKDLLLACLKGTVNQCDEAFIERQDGSPAWLRWDIKPWYNEDQEIGGLIIFTEDITAIKLKDAAHKQVSEILNKTSEISRIGTWSRNFRTNTAIYSSILKEILEVPEDYEPDYASGFKFYKEGASLKLVEKVMEAALKKGESFDIEVEIVTAKGNSKWVRVIGYPEFYNGKCEKISGVHQEIPFHNSYLHNHRMTL
jgi:PAS domain S-box-containing protein